MRFAPGALIGEAAALWRLTLALAGTPEVGRIVTDGTGLMERFDFTLTWEPVAPAGARGGAAAARQGPSIFTALEEQLGLRLRPTKATVDVMVIDRAEPPTPN